MIEDEIAMVDLNKTIIALNHCIDDEPLSDEDEAILISLRQILNDTLSQIESVAKEH